MELAGTGLSPSAVDSLASPVLCPWPSHKLGPHVLFFQIHLCRKKVASRSCHFYNNIEGKRGRRLFLLIAAHSSWEESMCGLGVGFGASWPDGSCPLGLSLVRQVPGIFSLTEDFCWIACRCTTCGHEAAISERHVVRLVLHVPTNPDGSCFLSVNYWHTKLVLLSTRFPLGVWSWVTPGESLGTGYLVGFPGFSIP